MNLVRPIFTLAALASLSATLALTAAGCVKGEDSDDGAGGKKPTGPYTLSGKLTFERVPYRKGQQGLDYAAVAAHPIRNVSVRLLNAADNVEIAAAVSGEDGGYTFTFEGPRQVKLWVYSETVEPQITVEDNTAGNAVYVIESAEIDAAKTPAFDFVVGTGWDGAAYAGPRAAAPFAVLDAAYQAARRFMTEVTPAPVFPPLKLNWSVNNRPESGSNAEGQIGTSHWDGSELYILGKEGIDTDEFDDHVIVHEWGHYFEGKLGRSDSVGGSHGYGDHLDPRVAMGEGWGNALSAMILDPDTVYADSIGQQQSEGFSYDLELNDTGLDSSPGWYSETTVEGVLFDVYDAANEPWDQVALGLQGVYSVATGPVKSSPAATTIFSFIAGLKAVSPADAGAIDDLVSHHTYDGTHGLDPIDDAWGTGETHGGGFPGTLPVFVDGDAGGAINLPMVGGTGYNSLAQNRFIRLSGTGGTVTITSTCTSDVDLYVSRDGVEVANGSSLSGDEEVSFNAASGTTYIVNVQGYENAPIDYTAVIQITN